MKMLPRVMSGGFIILVLLFVFSCSFQSYSRGTSAYTCIRTPLSRNYFVAMSGERDSFWGIYWYDRTYPTAIVLECEPAFSVRIQRSFQ